MRMIDIFFLSFQFRRTTLSPLRSSRAPTQEINEVKVININHKETKIENLFEFLGLQSFDGKFLPKKSFYEFFYKNDLNDFINLKQEIEKEINNKIKEVEIEEVLSTC